MNNRKRKLSSPDQALHELFDRCAPVTRADAEEELCDAGLDPRPVGARLERLARGLLEVHRTASDSPAKVDENPAAESGELLHLVDALKKPARGSTPVTSARRPRVWLRVGAALAAGICIGVMLGQQHGAVSLDFGRRTQMETRIARDETARHDPVLVLPPGRGAFAPGASTRGPEARGKSEAHSANELHQSNAAVLKGGTAPADEEEPASQSAIPGGGEHRPEDLQESAAARALRAFEADGGVAAQQAGEVSTWVLDSESWVRAGGRVPPAVLDRIRAGDYRFVVEEPQPDALLTNYSPSFWSASIENFGRFDVLAEQSEHLCALVDRETKRLPENWVGFPFPLVAETDRAAGCKIAWNILSARAMSGGREREMTILGAQSDGAVREITFSRRIAHYVGHAGEATEKPEGLRFAALLRSQESNSISGMASLLRRPHDWSAKDSVWQFLPKLRRVRSVSEPYLSDSLFGFNVHPEDFDGHNRKIESFRWTLAGTAEILAPFTSVEPLAGIESAPGRYRVDLPYPTTAYESDEGAAVPWAVVEHLRLVPRPAWIVEVRSDNPYHVFGKTILYVDRELYRVYWKAAFNHPGEEVYNAMISHHFARNPSGERSSVSWTLVMGLNIKTNGGAVAGRPAAELIEESPPLSPDVFRIQSLIRPIE